MEIQHEHSGNRPGTVWEPWYRCVLWTLFPHRVPTWRSVSWPRGNCSAPKLLSFRSAVMVAEAATGRIVSGIDPKVRCANEAPGNSGSSCISASPTSPRHLQHGPGQIRNASGLFSIDWVIDYRSSTGSSLLPALSSHPAFPAPKAVNPKDSPESTGAHV